MPENDFYPQDASGSSPYRPPEEPTMQEAPRYESFSQPQPQPSPVPPLSPPPYAPAAAPSGFDAYPYSNLPSRKSTVILTLIGSLFGFIPGFIGLIPAYQNEELLKQKGIPGGRYYKAFGLTLLLSWIVSSLLAFLFFLIMLPFLALANFDGDWEVTTEPGYSQESYDPTLKVSPEDEAEWKKLEEYARLEKAAQNNDPAAVPSNLWISQGELLQRLPQQPGTSSESLF